MFPKVTLILGGASSGKSQFAERLVKSSDKSAIYLATARNGDREMADRIARHRQSRGPNWHTVEVPLDVAGELARRATGEVVLLDCATLWLTNHLLAENELETECSALAAALRHCPADVIVVSNELGHGVVPDNALARRFSEAQGRLNQTLAKVADLVVFVTAGLPTVLKGSLPETGK